MEKTPHILNAASNLLGISFVIITGLNLTGRSRVSYADEIAWVATMCLTASCLLSYLALRRGRAQAARLERLADYAFLLGLFSLAGSVLWIALGGVAIG
ncbi:hypothetical protein [Sphingomonas quercus]|uniref:Uncharacterized protein n=1 Tax=Sphingomonas quercus TaxID=2842451 RepID=A0ABS6BMW3_9SPHN|nr:hypothetical protein [Sphingomonas quercus]MBU3079136.1 hypothetical protein [Sphingomonas quercus]